MYGWMLPLYRLNTIAQRVVLFPANTVEAGAPKHCCLYVAAGYISASNLTSTVLRAWSLQGAGGKPGGGSSKTKDKVSIGAGDY